MLIKHADAEPELTSEAVAEALNIAGLSNSSSKGDTDALAEARKIFKDKGASLENAAKTISDVMQRGEAEAARLRASEMVMKVHGILNDLDGKQSSVINININGTENKTLINLVLPV